MRAVVTGGAGFIGAHLVDRLRADGWAVEVIDRATGPSIQEYRGIPQADVIYHLASPVGPVGVLDWAGRLVSEVVTTTNIVRTWARWNGCPLIYVSTSEVYGSGSADHETDACTFGAATSARKEYAVAKLAGETMLRNSDVDARIVRPFNVAGPGQKADGGFVLPRFVAQALAGQPLTVYRPGTQRRAFAHVSDIVAGLVATYQHGERGEVYNLGNPDNLCTIYELAEEVVAEAGSTSCIDVVDPTTLHGPAFREAPDKVPVIAKAWSRLGWKPRITRRETVRDVVDSMRVAVAA